jgi:MFS family permease
MRNYIPNRQILYLFLSSNTILFIGMGLFPFLSVYATQLGASPTTIGVYFAAMYGSNAAGPLAVGWLTKRIARRPLFVALSVLGIPALVLMGQVTALWQLVVLTAIVWFAGGAQIALINVFTSLHADGQHRGKAFSLMSLAFPLGALFGGASVSYLLAAYGRAWMFVALAGVWSILPVIGIWGLQDKEDAPARSSATSGIKRTSTQVSGAFYLLILLSLLSTMAINVGRLGTPLSMQAHDFTPETIAGTATVAGLLTLPIALLIGALADRKGRRGVLALSYLFTIGAALMLIGASELWSFWLAATLNMVALGTNGALALALATDLLPSHSLNRGLSWIRAAQSSAGVLSFAASGYIMDTLGATALYVSAILLGSAAVLLLGLETHMRTLSAARIFHRRNATATVQIRPTAIEC